MKKIKLVVVLLLIPCISFCQQSVFSQYYFNPVFTNPAFTGNEKTFNIKSQYKSMWTGISDAPSIALITAQSPIGTSGSSIGISLLNDITGITSVNAATVHYAYRFETNVGRISVGTQIVIENYNQNLSGAQASLANDPALSADVNLFLFNAGFGIAWENDFGYFGIASPAILTNQLSENYTGESSKTISQLNITGAYTIPLNLKWNLSPSVLYKYRSSLPTQTDFQLHLVFNEKIQFDVGYRTNSTIITGIQYKIYEKLVFGYCYDVDNSTLGKVSGGSHELLISFSFNNIIQHQ